MTSVVINGTKRFQYASDGFLVGEAFTDAVAIDGVEAVVLEHVHGFSTAADVRWLQIFQTVDGTAPAAGAIPLVSIRIEAGAEFSWMPPMGGFRISGSELYGGAWWVSEAGDEYTASLDTFWVNAQGRAITESAT